MNYEHICAPGCNGYVEPQTVKHFQVNLTVDEVKCLLGCIYAADNQLRYEDSEWAAEDALREKLGALIYPSSS